MVDLCIFICVVCLYLHKQHCVWAIRKHVGQLRMQVNNYGTNMDEQASSSEEREKTDLHVRRNTATKISDGHTAITPLYIWTVGI
jgi:hypothetical protein